MKKLTLNTALLLLAMAVLGLALIWSLVLLIVQPAQVHAAIADGEPLQTFTRPSDAPIATYDVTDRRLIVTAHAPADLVVCFGEAIEHCRLVTDWRSR